MIERYHHALRITARLAHAGRKPALTLLLAFGLAGCRHKHLRQVLPQGVLAPVDLETVDDQDSLPEIATLPMPDLPLTPPPPPRPVTRRRPAASKEEPQPPVQVASAADPATLAIGALTTGGDAAPQSQQQAQDMIASIVKRIAALPAKIADVQKKQIRQIHNFLDQAQKALNSGDAEGASNLATKAKLLMDDLEKK